MIRFATIWLDCAIVLAFCTSAFTAHMMLYYVMI